MPFPNVAEFEKSFPQVKDLTTSQKAEALRIFNALKREEPDMDDGRIFAIAFDRAKKPDTNSELQEKYTPPESAKNNAKKVLEWRDKHGDEVKGMTATGWTRASQLASGKPISLETVKRMAQFNRHRKNAEVAPEHKGEPWKDNGYVAWLGWGGTSGIDWAMNISKNNMDDRFYYMTKLDEDDIEAFAESEVEVLRAGKIHDRGLQITMDMLQDFVRHFNDNVYGQDIPVNAEHKRGSEAMGWFKDLYIKGKSLMGKIEWTKLGSEKIKDKIFKFISAELGTVKHHLSGKNINNVLVGAGLTNTPAMKNQKALTAFSEEAKKYFSNHNSMEELKEKFNSLISKEELSEKDVSEFEEKVNSDFSEEEEAKKMLQELKDKMSYKELEMQNAEMKKKMAEMEKKMKEGSMKKLSEESKKIKELSEKFEEEKKEREELAEKLELKELHEEVRADLCFNEERKTGFSPKEETVSKVAKFMQGIPQESREEFKELLSEIRTVDLGELGADSKPEAKTSKDDEAKLKEANEKAKELSEKSGKPIDECLEDVYADMGLDEEK